MDDFKIELFKKEHHLNFPVFKSLTENECRLLATDISNKYNIDICHIEADLTLKQSYYNGANALDGFELDKLLLQLNIITHELIFVNWFKFERIDEFNINDLNKYFDDIWFPSADDIDLFDNSLNWIVSIRHDGVISFIKFVAI